MIKYIRTMEEVNAVEKSNLKVVSTFSGCGGSCLGYKMAGYNVVWANEFVDEAAKTYRANFPDVELCQTDIRKVDPKALVDKFGEIDLLDGSPPCSAFSTAGTVNKGWDKVKQYSDVSQRVDDLFFEYARFLDVIKPRAFIAENVSGLTKGVSKGYYNMILKTLSKGYNVKAFLLNAAAFGVPQARQRLFFIGARKDLGHKPTPPPQNQFKARIRDFEELRSIRDVLGGGSKDRWIGINRPYPTVTARIGGLSRTAYMSANGWVRDRDGSERKLTIDEGKFICSFPADFHLTGKLVQQWERIGRSVPPILMANISSHVRRTILGHP